jgi:hypothetical protein
MWYQSILSTGAAAARADGRERPCFSTNDLAQSLLNSALAAIIRNADCATLEP